MNCCTRWEHDVISRFPSRKRARGLKNPRTVGSIPPLDDNASKFNNLERAIGAIMFPTDNAVTPGRVMTMFEEVGAPRATNTKSLGKNAKLINRAGRHPAQKKGTMTEKPRSVPFERTQPERVGAKAALSPI